MSADQFSESPGNILFITLSCVGDVVMTTPVMEAVHAAYPEAKLDLVVDGKSRQLLDHCPYRGRFLEKDKNRFLRGAFDLVKQLLPIKYDAVVDLRTDGLAYFIRARKRFTKYGKKDYGPHAIESLMGVIREIHGDRKIPEPRLWLSDENREFAREQTDSFGGKRILAISPGGGRRQLKKYWPWQNYAALIKETRRHFDGVMLLGGPEEVEAGEKITDSVKTGIIDLTGRTDLLQVAALLEKTTLFIGSDSGLAHVAGAAGTDVVVFFSTDRPERCLPRGSRAMCLRGENDDARNIPVDKAVSEVENLCARTES